MQADFLLGLEILVLGEFLNAKTPPRTTATIFAPGEPHLSAATTTTTSLHRAAISPRTANRQFPAAASAAGFVCSVRTCSPSVSCSCARRRTRSCPPDRSRSARPYSSAGSCSTPGPSPRHPPAKEEALRESVGGFGEGNSRRGLSSTPL